MIKYAPVASVSSNFVSSSRYVEHRNTFCRQAARALQSLKKNLKLTSDPNTVNTVKFITMLTIMYEKSIKMERYVSVTGKWL